MVKLLLNLRYNLIRRQKKQQKLSLSQSNTSSLIVEGKQEEESEPIEIESYGPSNILHNLSTPVGQNEELAETISRILSSSAKEIGGRFVFRTSLYVLPPSLSSLLMY